MTESGKDNRVNRAAVSCIVSGAMETTDYQVELQDKDVPARELLSDALASIELMKRGKA